MVKNHEVPVGEQENAKIGHDAEDIKNVSNQAPNQNELPQVQMIDLDKIMQSRFGNGTRDEIVFTNLKQNIKEHGIQNPVRLIKIGDDKYEPYMGDHRVKAMKENGEKQIKAIVEDISIDKAHELCLSDNIVRAGYSDTELEKHVTELWNTNRYETRNELGRKLGLSGERIGQLINAHNIRQLDDTLNNKSITTQAILDTACLKKDEDRVAFLKLVKAKKYKNSEIKSKARMISKLSEEKRNNFLYHGEDLETIKKEAKEVEIPKDKKKTTTTTEKNKNMIPETYEFLKGLGDYIATIEDEEKRKQAIEYVKFSTGLLMRILVQEEVLNQSDFDTFCKNIDMDAKIIDKYDGYRTKSVGCFF
jgi:ParB/RepB/Spo0J family partition protein